MLLQERLKRRRQEIYEENQRAEEQWNKLHAEIDAWQAEIRKKENEKREVSVTCSCLILLVNRCGFVDVIRSIREENSVNRDIHPLFMFG